MPTPAKKQVVPPTSGKVNLKTVKVTKPIVGSIGFSFRSRVYRGATTTVTKIDEDSPLRNVTPTIHVGQILVYINGVKVENSHHAKHLISITEPGTLLTMKVCDNPHVTVVDNQEYLDPTTNRHGMYRGLWNAKDRYPTEHGTLLYHNPNQQQNGAEDFSTPPRTDYHNKQQQEDDTPHGNRLIYDGWFDHGLFHGPGGRLQWQNGDTYEGDFAHGKRSGFGLLQFHSDGRIYQGQFRSNLIQGWGTFVSPQYKEYYQGGLVKSKRHGYGRLVMQDGSWYEGFFENGLYSKFGILVQKPQRKEAERTSSIVYQGDFEEGLYHGHGTAFHSGTGRIMARGTFHRGIRVDDEDAAAENDDDIETDELLKDMNKLMPLPIAPPPKLNLSFFDECKVVENVSLADSDGHAGIYSGLVTNAPEPENPTFKPPRSSTTSGGVGDVVPHGVGRMVYNDGKRIHFGFWHLGSKEGYGRCIFLGAPAEGEPTITVTASAIESDNWGTADLEQLNGDLHQGWYHGNVRHGMGSYQWTDGKKFVGNYKDDVRHGYGTFEYPNGDVYRGEFENGQRCGWGSFEFGEVKKGTGKSYYAGQWQNGKYHGKGKLVWNNMVYEGDFENGASHGQGVKKQLPKQSDDEEPLTRKAREAKGVVTKEGTWNKGKFVGGQDAASEAGTSEDSNKKSAEEESKEEKSEAS